MPISKDLLLAILSMDSYNRGYGEGIAGLEGLGAKVGTATISTDSETVTSTKDEAQAAGFYAVAYDTEYGTVISYRGTDNPSIFASDTAGAADITAGWVTGGGVWLTDQVRLSQEFVDQADTQDGDSRTGSAILTGHSLGGALAGFVGAMNQ